MNCLTTSGWIIKSVCSHVGEIWLGNSKGVVCVCVCVCVCVSFFKCTLILIVISGSILGLSKNVITYCIYCKLGEKRGGRRGMKISQDWSYTFFRCSSFYI